MRNDKLFSDKSEIYKRARPNYPLAFFKALAAQCKNTQAVWDCACGSGQASEGLALEFTQVEASDISAQQLANAIPKDNINYQVAQAENTPFDNAQFDLICVAQALHWFDFEQFWPEVKRVLRPDGVFAAWGYNWPVWGEDLSAPLNKYVLDIIEPYFAKNNRLLWNHYREVDFPFEYIERPSLNMTVDWNLDELFDMLHSASATRVCMREKGDDFFHNAKNIVSEIWGNPEQRRTFEFDTVCIVASQRPLLAATS